MEEIPECLVRPPQPTGSHHFRESQPTPFTCQREFNKSVFKVSAFSLELCLPYHHGSPHAPQPKTNTISSTHKIGDSQIQMRPLRLTDHPRGFNLLPWCTLQAQGTWTDGNFRKFLIHARHFMHKQDTLFTWIHILVKTGTYLDFPSVPWSKKLGLRHVGWLASGPRLMSQSEM